jgi:hypothetical protein
LNSDSEEIAEISGLDMLIKHASYSSFIRLDVMPAHCQYRPMIDEILRVNIGVDFETAVNIQRYIDQLLKTWKGALQSEPLKVNRRNLRNDIVKRAQRIWRKTTLEEEDEAILRTGGADAKRMVLARRVIVFSRDRWAPASELSKFLFPARLLADTSLWLPYDSEEQWLEDPTFELRTSREVLRAGPHWVKRKAKEMVMNLASCNSDGIVTTWLNAAVGWQLQRIQHDLDSTKYVRNLAYGGPRLDKPKDVCTAHNNRLDVIAKKLRIDPLFPVGTLTDWEKGMAVACFNKFVTHRCSGCPQNNLLILPCGLKGIVRHFSKYHPRLFWLSDKWNVRG